MDIMQNILQMDDFNAALDALVAEVHSGNLKGNRLTEGEHSVVLTLLKNDAPLCSNCNKPLDN
uniref:Uncharacterized protein n=1 Tax=viral metagenome TaxID=1070528 RepID=A0A6M3KXH7_9ZZZZ